MEVVGILYLLLILFHVVILLLVVFVALYIFFSNLIKRNNKSVIEDKVKSQQDFEFSQLEYTKKNDCQVEPKQSNAPNISEEEKNNSQQDFELSQLMDVNKKDYQAEPKQSDIPNISEEEIFCLEEENKQDYSDYVAEEWTLNLKSQLGSSESQQNSAYFNQNELNQEKDLSLQDQNTGKKERKDYFSQLIELRKQLEIKHQEDLEKQFKLYEEKKLSEQKQKIEKKEQKEKLSQLNQEDLDLIEKLSKQQSELMGNLKHRNSNIKIFNMQFYNDSYLYLKSINRLDKISLNKYFYNLIESDIKRKKIIGVYKLLYNGSEINNFNNSLYHENSTDVAINAEIEFNNEHFDFIERISCYLKTSVNKYLNELIIEEQSIQLRKKDEIKNMISFDFD